MESMRALITAGPTREPVDPVRFLSNASSGRQGVALAEEALSRGWAVDLVHGPLEVALPAAATNHGVRTAAEMLERCRALHARCSVMIAAAAVSDYRPRSMLEHKHKRADGSWNLELVPTVDIAATLGEVKESRVHAGFALETMDLRESGRRKLETKNFDWLVANGPEALGRATAEYVLLGAGGQEEALGRLSKRALAHRLWDAIEATLADRR